MALDRKIVINQNVRAGRMVLENLDEKERGRVKKGSKSWGHRTSKESRKGGGPEIQRGKGQ